MNWILNLAGAREDQGDIFLRNHYPVHVFEN